MTLVEIYTDGACKGNPGPGGWAAMLFLAGTAHRKILSGGFRRTTNNRMELMAAINALEILKFPCEVNLYTDSRYLADAVGKNWLSAWIRRNWIKADGKPVLNVDLWKRLDHMLRRHHVKIIWLAGHAGHPENERCDQLARQEAARPDLPEDTFYQPEN